MTPGAVRVDPRSIGVAAAGIATFLNLYTTQAILPVLAHAFHVAPERTGLSVTAPLLAVAAVAPFVGSISDRLGRKRLIVGAAFLVVIPTLLTAAAGSLATLLLWRFAQGLLLPFIFAVTVAYIGEECPGAEGIRVTGSYALGTIIAGFGGRFIAGIASDLVGWRAAFVLIAGLTGLSAVAIAWLLPREQNFRRMEGGLRAMLAGFLVNITDRRLIGAFVMGFGVLFSMVATFTYANLYLAAPPFRLRPAQLGSVFIVYLLGMVTTPIASRIATRLGRRRGVIATIPVALAGCALLLVPSLSIVITGLALMACAVFIEQTFSIGYVGSTARSAKSTAVGLYVTAYYTGGSLGGVVPAGIWRYAGWPGCVALVAFVQAAMLGGALLFWRDDPPATSRSR